MITTRAPDGANKTFLFSELADPRVYRLRSPRQQIFQWRPPRPPFMIHLYNFFGWVSKYKISKYQNKWGVQNNKRQVQNTKKGRSKYQKNNNEQGPIKMDQYQSSYVQNTYIHNTYQIGILNVPFKIPTKANSSLWHLHCM